MRTVSVLVGTFSLMMIASPLVADEPDSITIRDKTFNVWPVEDLHARGFEVRQIPQSQNAAWMYIEAINAYEELPEGLAEAFEYAVYTAWPEGMAELEDYLELPGNRKAFDSAQKAAAMDEYQMPYFGDPPGSILGVLLPNLSPMRFLSKLILADTRRLVAQREYDRAIDLHFGGMRMGSHVGSCMTLIEGLVGIAVWSNSNRALQDMVLRQPLSKKQLENLLDRLNKHAERLPTIKQGLHGERSFGPTVVDELCSRPIRFLAISPFNSDMGDLSFLNGQFNANPEEGWGRLELRVGRLLFPDRAIKRHMNDYYDKLQARADQGPRGTAALTFDEERFINESIPKWDVLSRFLLPSLSRAITLGERLKTVFAITRGLVALRLYMLENDDQVPTDLEEIAGTLPNGALSDPFGDGLLRYIPTDTGFVLYSVGPDLTDDGGKKGERWDRLDMAYKYPPEAVEPFGKEGE